MALFAAVRISELVTLTKQKQGGLKMEDLFINGTGIKICIRQSKTDQIGKGYWIVLNACRKLTVCSMALLKSYLEVRLDVKGHFLYILMELL